MKYEFIANHEDDHKVALMCRILKIKRSGYYSWRKRPVSQRKKENQELGGLIAEAFQISQKTYGSPRIRAQLQQEGILCGHNRVARLMRERKLVARKVRKNRPWHTQSQPGAVVAPNVLNQDFTATAPNQKWVTDITYIDTAEGWMYLASIVDLYSRKVVGWAMDAHMGVELVEKALRMALSTRRPSAQLLHHSDRGSQYTSAIYREQLAASHCQVSMSRKGNCYDNAVMESFFSTLKFECVVGQFKSRKEARSTIFEYIEVWYNRKRLHSTLGYLSPLAFEQKSVH